MRWSWFTVGAALCGLLACSSGGTDDEAVDTSDAGDYEAGRQAECRGLCVGLRRCGNASSDCDNICVSEFQPVGIRGSALEAIGACLQDEDCESLAAENPSSACFDEVGAVQPLRETVVDYCESATRNYFRCNIWWSLEACANRMGVWEDDTLRSAMSCLYKNCDELETCEKAVFQPEP